MMRNADDARRTLLLVDFENVQKLSLKELPAGWRVQIFVGSSQKNLPFDLAQQAQALGDRLSYSKSERVGPNALDFMIAFTLGQELTRAPDTHCVILSKDHGFDPLIKHLGERGMHCRRVNSQMELKPTEVKPVPQELTRTLEVLRRSPKNRPRKRTTLTAYVANILKVEVGDRKVEDVIDLLFRDNHISEAADKISYAF